MPEKTISQSKLITILSDLHHMDTLTFCGKFADSESLKRLRLEDTDCIEEYSPEEDAWKTITIKLPYPMINHVHFVN